MDKENIQFPIKLFVYGTLKKTYSNHAVLGKSKFLKNAETSGILLHLGGYPGFLETLTGLPVLGELYEVPDQETLDAIDRLEGHPNHYTRQQISLVGGERVWTYIYTTYFERAKTHQHYAVRICPSGTWIGQTTHAVPFLGFMNGDKAPKTLYPCVAHITIPGVFTGIADCESGRILKPKWGSMDKPHLTYDYKKQAWTDVKDIANSPVKGNWTGPITPPVEVKKQEDWKPYVDLSDPPEVDLPERNVANG